MGTPSAIRQALAASLSGLNLNTYQFVPSNPTPPCVYVGDGPIKYDLTAGTGIDELTFTVAVVLSFTMDEAAQAKLDGLRASTGGVKSLIEADKTLGGACSGLQVTEATGSQMRIAQGQPPACGTTWTVKVLTPRN